VKSVGLGRRDSWLQVCGVVEFLFVVVVVVIVIIIALDEGLL
jgi:hypothetical protein